MVIQQIINKSTWSPNNLKKSESHDNFFSFIETSRNIPDIDNPKRFFNSTFEINIHKLPTIGKVKKKPWSGSYWPMRNGIISVRYGKYGKNTIGEWNPFHMNYTRRFTFLESINKYNQPDDQRQQTQYNITNFESYVYDYYSPSEKYDLFMGDDSFTLTNWNKNDGMKYIKEFKGDLPSWFGICHGWAPAAYYHKKPVKPVNVTASDGKTTITFLPDDIKALASLHLANLNYKTNFVGAICKVYPPNKPITDNSTGLYLDYMCHSLNPGSFVIVLGNHVGLKSQNLVIDPLSDHEVWNQPILSNLIRYFNLVNQEFSSDPKWVKVPIEFLKNSTDKFFNFLSKRSDMKTVSVVGVFINITYIYI